MKKTHLPFLLLALTLLPGSMSAQATLEEGDPLAQVLFEPELIMQHRRAVNLTDEQRDAITRLIEELQGRVVGLQWQLLDEMQALSEILEGPRVDLDRAMGNAPQVRDGHVQLTDAPGLGVTLHKAFTSSADTSVRATKFG